MPGRGPRSRKTRPEIRVRQIARRLGFRFRLHRSDLPGKPDISSSGRHKAIFVHGCFWHQHRGCRRAALPKSNTRFWRAKLARNAARDTEQLAAIRKLGWRALVVWECEIKNERRLSAKMRRFISHPPSQDKS